MLQSEPSLHVLMHVVFTVIIGGRYFFFFFFAILQKKKLAQSDEVPEDSELIL